MTNKCLMCGKEVDVVKDSMVMLGHLSLDGTECRFCMCFKCGCKLTFFIAKERETNKFDGESFE